MGELLFSFGFSGVLGLLGASEVSGLFGFLLLSKYRSFGLAEGVDAELDALGLGSALSLL